jgi:hypothetical protein
MWKTILAATAALAIAGGSLVYAQQPPAEPDGGPHWRPSAEDVSAFGDARIAGLKAGLRLTAEQEKHWPAFEKALRDRAKLRSERFAARASADSPADPIARLRTRAETILQTGTTLKAVADTAAPLYQSLDEAQKRRFMILSRLEGGSFGQGRGHHGRGMMGRGHGGPGGMMDRDQRDPERIPPPQ